MPEVRQPSVYDSVLDLRRSHRQRLVLNNSFSERNRPFFWLWLHASHLRLQLNPSNFTSSLVDVDLYRLRLASAPRLL